MIIVEKAQFEVRFEENRRQARHEEHPSHFDAKQFAAQLKAALNGALDLASSGGVDLR